jgi:hypothetical protein
MNSSLAFRGFGVRVGRKRFTTRAHVKNAQRRRAREPRRWRAISAFTRVFDALWASGQREHVRVAAPVPRVAPLGGAAARDQ